ncbi:hypothetical protein D3C75_1266930 [compost metagenome]
MCLDDLLNQLQWLEFNMLDSHFASAKLRHIQTVVYDVQERLSGLTCQIQVFFLLFGNIAHSRKLDHAHNAV